VWRVTLSKKTPGSCSTQLLLTLYISPPFSSSTTDPAPLLKDLMNSFHILEDDRISPYLVPASISFASIEFWLLASFDWCCFTFPRLDRRPSAVLISENADCMLQIRLRVR
jgi:hypothetical protein